MTMAKRVICLKMLIFSENLAATAKWYYQIESCTAIDEMLQVLKATVLNGWRELKRNCPKLIYQYWPFRDEITIQDGILYKGQTVIIPTSMRREMLEAIHCSHPAIVSCLRRHVLFWPDKSAQVEDVISKCSTCIEYAQRQSKEPLLNYPISSRPFGKLAIDLFVYNSLNYVVLVDYFSDFWEIAMLNNTMPNLIIEFRKQQFSRHGIPNIVISERVPN